MCTIREMLKAKQPEVHRILEAYRERLTGKEIERLMAHDSYERTKGGLRQVEAWAMKPWAESFYKSKAWVKCRLAFLKSKFFICERCQGAAIIAHHRTYLTPLNINDPSITLNWDNLEALCQDCHNRLHHGEGNTAIGLEFDVLGNLVQK